MENKKKYSVGPGTLILVVSAIGVLISFMMALGGKRKKLLNLTGFASEPQFIDASEGIGDLHTAGRESTRIAEGRPYRKLQDEIDAGMQSGLGPYVFVKKRRFAALHKIPAHHGDQEVAAGSFTDLADEIFVSPVQRVEFGYYN